MHALDRGRHDRVAEATREGIDPEGVWSTALIHDGSANALRKQVRRLRSLSGIHGHDVFRTLSGFSQASRPEGGNRIQLRGIPVRSLAGSK